MGNRVIRYICSGGIATAVNVAFLYFFTQIVGWWYLISAVASFLVAFGVGFSLQKFWTFQGKQSRRKREQLPMYLGLNLANLALNTLGLYLLVDWLKLWYLLSQVIMSGALAVSSYFIYQLVIFKRATENPSGLTPVDTQ